MARFATDNNGVIVRDAAHFEHRYRVSHRHAGVRHQHRQSNNKLAAAQTFTTDAFGDLNNSTFNGSKVQAFFDSGSNAYFFADSSLPRCSAVQRFLLPVLGADPLGHAGRAERRDGNGEHRHPQRGNAV